MNMKEYTDADRAILSQITAFCRDHCSERGNCPEEECVLWRIEKIVEGGENDGE